MSGKRHTNSLGVRAGFIGRFIALNDESTLISAGLQRQRGWLVYRESPESAL